MRIDTPTLSPAIRERWHTRAGEGWALERLFWRAIRDATEDGVAELELPDNVDALQAIVDDASDLRGTHTDPLVPRLDPAEHVQAAALVHEWLIVLAAEQERLRASGRASEDDLEHGQPPREPGDADWTPDVL